MPSFICGMCGEFIDVRDTESTVKCPHCGTVQAVVRDKPKETGAGDSVSHDAGLDRHVPQGMTKGMKIIICAAAAFAVAVLVGYQAIISGRGKIGGISDVTPQAAKPAIDPQTEKDRAETLGWYLQAANSGDIVAQYSLGEMYSRGESVERDVREAAKWYRMAAERDHAGAQNKLGNAFYNGWGVVKNYKEAARWYRKAALRGSMEAQTALGNMFYNGTGVGKSYPNAVWWYSMAARDGYAWAQYYLGNMYRNGLGVPKSMQQARDLYKKAMEQGHLGALGAYEHIKDLE